MATISSTIRGEETASGEQFPLFDVGMNLSELRSELAEIVTHAQAFNTVKGYTFSWRVFERWCVLAGKQSLPASSDTVNLFITWATSRGPHGRKPKPYKITNVSHILSAIQDRHLCARLPNPIDDDVREAMSGLARKYDEERGGKDALTPEHLRRTIQGLPGTPIGKRDAAIILVGFTTGWRSCELAALRFSEVRFFERHMLFLLRRSKTDQKGKGREVRIPRVPDSELCPVAALEAWVEVRGAKPGSLFLPFSGTRLAPNDGVIGPQVVRDVLKRSVKRAGIKHTNYGAHSLRSGMITAAAENGADVLTIAERTGHQKLETIAKYVRAAGGFRRDPLAGVL